MSAPRMKVVRLVLPDRKTGFQPVINESSGWKPVGHDRQDACPPMTTPRMSLLLKGRAFRHQHERGVGLRLDDDPLALERL